MSNPDSPRRASASTSDHDLIEVHAAFDRVPAAPSEERGDRRTVRTSHATEAELDDIEKAIDHPPTKVDHFGTAVSVLGAIVVILKVKASPVDNFGPKDLGLILGASALGGAQFVRYLAAIFAKTPLKDLAKRHLRRLKMAQGWKPEDDQVPNWQRLRNALWARVHKFLESKK